MNNEASPSTTLSNESRPSTSFTNEVVLGLSDFLLQESGDNLLLETGDKIISQTNPITEFTIFTNETI